MPNGIRFEIRLPHALAVRIDDWRRKMPGLPNRAEAARQLIERGLAPPAVASAPEKEDAPPSLSAQVDLARCRWLSPEFRDGGDQAMNVRIADRVALQVAFLVRHAEVNKRQFVEDILREACARKLSELGIAP